MSADGRQGPARQPNGLARPPPNLSNMSAATRAILLNKEIIAIDQDTLGDTGPAPRKRVTRRFG
jgi:hypothetical protein